MIDSETHRRYSAASRSCHGHDGDNARDHRRSQDFLCGGALFLTKNLMTFFSHHLLFPSSYALYLATSGGCTSPNSPQFCLISIKIAYKNFFRRPGGVHLHPLHLPWLRLWMPYNSDPFYMPLSILYSGFLRQTTGLNIKK